ncbi:MAG TPA: hypothetical protein VGN80_02620 [Devosiaceae bacterium]|nr:hypothetical protein [Devosiaceae bacterium]
MTPETFRNWLAERGCTFEQTERQRGQGVASVIVRCGSRRSELPNASSRKDLEDEEVRRIMDDLDLPYDELPGPQSRV